MPESKKNKKIEKTAGFTTKDINDDIENNKVKKKSITASAEPIDETELEDLGSDKKDDSAEKLKQALSGIGEKKKSITKDSEPKTTQKDKKEDKKNKKEKSVQINLNKYLIKFQKIKLKDRIFFTKNLGVMLKAGLSLGQALTALAEQTSNPKFKKILKSIETKVKKGESFSDSLKLYPKTFNHLFVSMIASGEKSGNLEDVLKQLHKQMSRDHELISRVKGAMVYPAVVLTAMVGIGTAVMILVVPKFITIFEEFEAELPLPTRILIKVSHFITDQGWWILLFIFVVLFFIVRILRTAQGTKFLHAIFLKTPILGNIVKKINLARFSRTLSSLLKTNIPIVEAFKITSNVVGNSYYKESIKVCSERIKKGDTIHKCISEYKKLFPPTVIQMTTVGEESGSLDDVLEELAGFYEDEINQTMKNLPNIIEPVLMLVLGLGVAAMAVAVLMPMYSLSQTF